MSVDRPGLSIPGFVADILAAYGIDPSDVVCIDRPTRVEKLVGATAQFHNGAYVDPGIERTWARIATRLLRPRTDTPPRIFVTRTAGLSRRCHNAAELEAIFVDHGFALIQPELHTTAEQATLFAGAQILAGYGGSGQFNAVFRAALSTRIVISSDSYYASNEWLISSVKGDQYHHFWCPADVPRRRPGFDNASFHSDFTFDLERDEARLRRVREGCPL